MIDGDLSDERLVQPAVAQRESNRSVWIFAICLAVVAGMLFLGLEKRRAATGVLALQEPNDQSEQIISAATPVPLPLHYMLPQQPFPEKPGISEDLPSRPVYSRAPDFADRVASGYRFDSVPRRGAAPRQLAYEDNPYKASMAGAEPERPNEVYNAPNPPLGSAGGGEVGGSSDRVQAYRFVNPATTVPKGSVIQAVMESAVDSTRAGMARAIISRDVRGFDGTRILVPKGSRLIGEYKADLTLGQNRALIQWQRLVRPDGVEVNLDSPSADPLGRSGVKGKVNSHFLQRFGGSILQSVLDIGTQVAVNRLSSGTTILAVPNGAFQSESPGQSAAIPGQEKVQPTLTVRQGTSVSVFVARDLDFTSVE